MIETRRPLKVFLCHASQDKPRVRELAQRLFTEGWIDPWLDEKKLLPGQDWRLKIEEAVETSDIVIICLSSNSVSKEGFVQKELRYAREISLEKLEESIFLIPLRIDECDVPRGLRFYQWADYFGEKQDETYNALLESLRLRYEQKLKIEKEERARKEKEKTERETAEKIAREKVEREVAERIAKEKAVMEAIEKSKREKAEREATERIAKEKALMEAVEKSKREKAEHRAARKAGIKKSISKSFATLKSALISAIPFFRIAGIVGIIILLFWGGSLGVSRLISLIPTAIPSATIKPTFTHLPSTKTPVPMATKTRVPTATPRPSMFSIYDNFSSGSLNKKFDAALWGNPSNQTAISWQNGYLVFSGTNCDCVLPSKLPTRWRIDQIGKLQADLRIDKVTGGYGFTKFQILTNLSDGKGTWWTQCRVGSFDEKNAQIYCDSYRQKDAMELQYQTNEFSIEFSKFYTVAIELAPDASIITYYVNNKEIGSYKPPEKNFLSNANFTWQIGLFADSGVSATGAIDNVMIGVLK